MTERTISRFAAAAAAAIALTSLVACGPANRSSTQSSQSATQSPRETPVASETNPSGDIPDSQAFVEYISPAGYSLMVPEGWARIARGANVIFTDKFDGISVAVPRVPDTPASIEASGRAGSGFKTQAASLPAGPAVEVTFASNSDPDQVTGKRVRLENDVVILRLGVRHATVRLWAPLGADNVDQWNSIKRSFRFR
ncbi:MAG TPA: hypothetical protein VJN22_00650 [Candidatus Eremiobacteraceae bacterium]|nr:hypothetical protein [Candidatus Eremiobacteraceae bacterium]